MFRANVLLDLAIGGTPRRCEPLLSSLTFSFSLLSVPPSPDIRWHQRLRSFRKAFDQLDRATSLAAERELSDLEQQGLIQAFEFTHELAWKTLRDFLESRGAADIYGSRDVTREAFAKGLIENGEAWMDMIQSRIQTSHSYNQETADEIANAVLSSYLAKFRQLLARLSELEESES